MTFVPWPDRKLDLRGKLARTTNARVVRQKTTSPAVEWIEVTGNAKLRGICAAPTAEADGDEKNALISGADPSFLKILFCSDCGFSTYPENVHVDFPALSMVAFRNNAMQSIPERSFFPGCPLRWLILPNNRLKQLPKSFGTCLSSLQKCGLSGNLLESLPQDLSGLKSLELLRLADNQFTKVPQALLELPRLAFFGIAGNEPGFPAMPRKIVLETRSACKDSKKIPTCPHSGLPLFFAGPSDSSLVLDDERASVLGEGTGGKVVRGMLKTVLKSTGPDTDKKKTNKFVAVKLFKFASSGSLVSSDGGAGNELSALARLGGRPPAPNTIEAIGLLVERDGHRQAGGDHHAGGGASTHVLSTPLAAVLVAAVVTVVVVPVVLSLVVIVTAAVGAIIVPTMVYSPPARRIISAARSPSAAL